jgi:oxygen-independent coproporphyrinogen-3 oxidase
VENWRRGGFGLYVHWPFCEAKCPYCDFNSHVTDLVDETLWKETLLADLERLREATAGRTLSTIFFGGGTPSLMPPAIVASIIDRAGDIWAYADDLEVSLEANPSSVEAKRLREFRAAGVNRVSLGLQALDDVSLRLLGRRHTADEGKSALWKARESFDRVSLDLIYARQGQTMGSWEAELTEALEMAAGHLSLYQLTIEPGTVFERRKRAGRLSGLPDDDLSADMFDLTRDICRNSGLIDYETSNYARPGQECRHNLIYWRGGDWGAIGPGSHGRITDDGQRLASEAHSLPKRWLEAVTRGESSLIGVSVVPPLDRVEEYCLMAIRLREGIDLEHVRDLGYSIGASAAIDGGLAEVSGSRLQATEAGRPLLNTILGSLSFEPIREEFA